jgi:glycosyltransferase involved in cell wall biosynthesis
VTATGEASILHVDPERGWGGGETQVLGLMRHLAATGHRQTLAAAPRGRLAPAAADLGVTVVPVAIRNHADLVAGRRLAGLIARNHHDIVHFHSARAHAMSAFLGRVPAARVVTRRMDYAPRGGWYARWLYNHGVDAVVAISEGVRQVLVRSGVEPARIHVVASGVDVARFAAAGAAREAERARHGIDPATLVIVSVAALETRKGHAVLLDAIAALPDLALLVLCAGGGSEAEALAARRDALGLGSRVRFLGAVADVAPLLAAADVVVMPSLQEGLGVAALEAMAAAKAVVASRVGGLAEVVDDRVSGLLVEPGDARGLAAAIRRLAGDRDATIRFGAAGRERVERRFSMRAMGEGTLAVYRRVLDAPPTSAADAVATGR